MAHVIATNSLGSHLTLSETHTQVSGGTQVTVAFNTTGYQAGQPIPYTLSGSGITASSFDGLSSLTGTIEIDRSGTTLLPLTLLQDALEQPNAFTITVNVGNTPSMIASVARITSGHLLYTINSPTIFGPGQDKFGSSVAVSGNNVIIGAPGADQPYGTGNVGAAYIFDLITGQHLRTLYDPNTYDIGYGDIFGTSVDIDGNYAIVGAPGEGDYGGTSSGKAYIYNVTTGQRLFTLDNPNAYGTSTSDGFGTSVGISGNYAIVSAPGEDESGGTSSGKAYIYNVTTGLRLFTLSNPNVYGTVAGDGFGTSVGISGNYAIVGAPHEDDSGGTDSGKAYIYNVTTGQRLFTLSNPNAYGSATGDDYFGYTVAIDGSYAVVGAYNESEVGSNKFNGAAYVFNVTTGQMVQSWVNPNIYGTMDDYFGYTVAINGEYVAVSAPFEDDDGGATSGVVYIFNATTGQSLRTLVNPNTTGTSLGDAFGSSVAIRAPYVIASAPNEDVEGSYSGTVYIFD